MYLSLRFKKIYIPSLLVVIVVGICLLGSTKIVTHAASEPLKSPSKAGVTPSISTLTCGTWSIVSSPNAGSSNNDLRAVSAISSTNAWAVGSYLDSNNNPLTLIEQWDGSSWNVMSSPNPGSAYNSLFGVDAISANNVWAVGYYSNSSNASPSQTLIEHWNGKIWSVVSSPSPGSANNLLFGVSRIPGTSQLWAVGDYNSGNAPNQTLTEYWNGSSWNVVSSPTTGLGAALTGVVVLSANSVWAVGNYSNSTFTDQTLVEYWNGSIWSIVSSPSPAATYNVLSGVTGITSTGNIWAVGYIDNSNTGPEQNLIERWNGTTWGVVSSPDIGSGSNQLNNVAAITAKNIWAVGTSNNSVGSYGQTLVEHWDGKVWSVVSSPNIGSGNNSLIGIARIRGTSILWAVGWYTNANNTTQTLIESYC